MADQTVVARIVVLITEAAKNLARLDKLTKKVTDSLEGADKATQKLNKRQAQTAKINKTQSKGLETLNRGYETHNGFLKDVTRSYDALRGASSIALSTEIRYLKELQRVEKAGMVLRGRRKRGEGPQARSARATSRQRTEVVTGVERVTRPQIGSSAADAAKAISELSTLSNTLDRVNAEIRSMTERDGLPKAMEQTKKTKKAFDKFSTSISETSRAFDVLSGAQSIATDGTWDYASAATAAAAAAQSLSSASEAAAYHKAQDAKATEELAAADAAAADAQSWWTKRMINSNAYLDEHKDKINNNGDALQRFINQQRRAGDGASEFGRAFREVSDFSFFKTGLGAGMKFWQINTMILAILPLIGTAAGGLGGIINGLATGFTVLASSAGRAIGVLALIPGILGAVAAAQFGIRGLMSGIFTPAMTGEEQINQLSQSMQAARVSVQQATTPEDKAVAQNNLNLLTEKYNRILARTPKNAKLLTDQVEDLKDTWISVWQGNGRADRAIGTAVQVMRRLQGFIRSIEPGIEKIFITLQYIGTELGRALANPAVKKFFIEALSKGADNLERFWNLAKALAPVMGGLFNASQDFTARIADSLSVWAAGLDSDSVVERLTSYLERAEVTLYRIVAVLKNVGSGLKNIFTAALPTTERFETDMVSISERFKEWTSEAQPRIAKFFENTYPVLQAIGRLVLSIATAFGTLAGTTANSPTGAAGNATSILVSFIDQLGRGIEDFASFAQRSMERVGPELIEFWSQVGEMLDTASPAAIEAVTYSLKILTETFKVLNKVTETKLGGVLVKAIIVTRIISMVLGALVGGAVAGAARFISFLTMLFKLKKGLPGAVVTANLAIDSLIAKIIALGATARGTTMYPPPRGAPYPYPMPPPAPGTKPVPGVPKSSGKFGRVLKGVGKRLPFGIGAVVTGGLIASDVANASSMPEQPGVRKSETMGGAVGGGVGGIAGGVAGGALAGAAIGTVVATPGIGTLIGTIVGAIVGGIAGSVLGEKIGKVLGPPLTDAYHTVEGWARDLYAIFLDINHLATEFIAGFLEPFVPLWEALKDAASWTWDLLEPFRDVADIIGSLVESAALMLVAEAFQQIKSNLDLLKSGLDWFVGKIQALAKALNINTNPNDRPGDDESVDTRSAGRRAAGIAVPAVGIYDNYQEHGVSGMIENLTPGLPGGYGLPFADGGVVPGTGPKRDSVPAMLTPGEVVLNDKQQAMVGPNRINRALGGAGMEGAKFFAGGGVAGNSTAYWPTNPRGSIGGRPYQGTHTLGNWESDNALDIMVPEGSSAIAITNAVVDSTGGSNNDPSSRFNGFRTTISGGGNSWFYTHLASLAVRAGQEIAAGSRIGTTGSANGVPHLHIGQRTGDPQSTFGASLGTGSTAGGGGATGTAQAFLQKMQNIKLGDIRSTNNRPLTGSVRNAAEDVKSKVQTQANELIMAANEALAGRNTSPVPIEGTWSGGAVPPDSPGAAKAYARYKSAQMWGPEQFGSLNELWTQESGWLSSNWNDAGSGAYGIPQALPASKMGNESQGGGADYLTNPATQINWGLNYIKGRYGNPDKAWQFHGNNNWYGEGGEFIASGGPQVIGVGEKGPERVSVQPLSGAGSNVPRRAGGSGGGEGAPVHITSSVSVGVLVGDESGLEQLTGMIGDRIYRDLKSVRASSVRKA